MCLILARCFDNSACKSGGGVQMHLINYLQPIYASLVAGHVFCTSNGMLNWFENQLPCVIYLDLQEPYGTEEPPNHTFSRKVHDISSSPGKPASFLQKVSFKEVKKGNVSTENNIDESFFHFIYFLHCIFLVR